MKFPFVVVVEIYRLFQMQAIVKPQQSEHPSVAPELLLSSELGLAHQR